MSFFKKAKNLIKNCVSDNTLESLKRFRDRILYIPNCIYDTYRYSRYSTTALSTQNKEKLRAMLTKNFHIIEKGLSLKEPRPGFGQPVVKKLLWQITVYLEKFGPDETIQFAINSLKSYEIFNANQGIHLCFLSEKISSFNKSLESYSLISNGGTLAVTREQILKSLQGNFKEMTENRFSIRSFSSTPVSEKFIEEAVDIARKTPSVCNRQTARIFSYRSGKLKDELLLLQNGNRGFGHLASHIIVVTSDLQCFTGVGERHQAYIDGGLMAMSLVYALHSLGIGSCFLNWSVTADIDKKFRSLAGIPKSHVIITLLAIGNIPETLNVAESPRLPVREILTQM